MKKYYALLLALLMLFSFAACSANEKSNDAVEIPTEFKVLQADEAEYYASVPSNLYGSTSENLMGDRMGVEYDGQVNDAVPSDSGQKLIRTIRLTVETDDYQAFMDSVTGRIAALGGYIEELDASNSGSSPSATMIVRVPADQLSALTDSVAGIGNVTYKHESQQDVTLQYVDTESHIAALRTEQDRLLQLLNKAENLSEILEIEDRMTYVRYQLENYEQSLRALSNKVDYATATIDVRQVKIFTPTEEPGYWEKIGNGIIDTVKSMWEFLTGLFSDFVISLPYLLLFLGVPLVILIVLIKRFKHKRREKKAARQEQSTPDATEK